MLEKLEEPYAEGIFHLSYGMVDLPEGKMKSREGTVVDADDLMDEMEKSSREFSRAKRQTTGLHCRRKRDTLPTDRHGSSRDFILGGP